MNLRQKATIEANRTATGRIRLAEEPDTTFEAAIDQAANKVASIQSDSTRPFEAPSGIIRAWLSHIQWWPPPVSSPYMGNGGVSCIEVTLPAQLARLLYAAADGVVVEGKDRPQGSVMVWLLGCLDRLPEVC